MKRSYQFMVAFLLIMLLAASASGAGYLRGGHYTLEELDAAVQGVAKKNPELATIEEIGRSVEGRPLLLLKIGRPDKRERAEALIYGTAHADEWTGNRVALAIAERLAADDGHDPWISSLLDRIDFYIIPLLNPDGYVRASKQLDRGFTLARGNAHHVDLNRNWPQARGSAVENIKGAVLGGNRSKLSLNYRGPYPLSEPENQALDRLVAGHDFFMIFDLHTAGGRFSYPWSFQEAAAPDQDLFEAVGREMIAHQAKYPYQAHQSYSWYQILGSSKDWFYGHYGSPAVTIELGIPSEFDKKELGLRALNPFYRANPLDVQPWIENDRDAILYAAQKAYELTNGEPLSPQDMEWIREE